MRGPFVVSHRCLAREAVSTRTWATVPGREGWLPGRTAPHGSIGTDLDPLSCGTVSV